MQKALDTVSESEKRQIVGKYISMGEVPEPKKTITLTEKEREWLAEHPVIRFTGDPFWLPFEAFNEAGEYIGIVSDHLCRCLDQ